MFCTFYFCKFCTSAAQSISLECDTFKRISAGLFQRKSNAESGSVFLIFCLFCTFVYVFVFCILALLKADLHGSHPEDCDLHFCFFIFSLLPDTQQSEDTSIMALDFNFN